MITIYHSDTKMFHITTKCPSCGGTNQLKVNPEDYFKWRNGSLIQDAFPNMPPWERELLLSGICSGCWKKLFGGLENNEE